MHCLALANKQSRIEKNVVYQGKLMSNVTRHCKVVEYAPGTVTVIKVKELIDIDEVYDIKLTTHVHPPYRSILYSGTEVYAATQHNSIREALRFHRTIAKDLHTYKN